MSVLPFGNRVVTVELTGASLRAALERSLASTGRRTGSLLQVSGLAFVADLSAPEGRRLVEARAGGAPLRDDAIYLTAVSSHLASGGDGYVELAAASRPAGGRPSPLDADALAAHLGRLSGVRSASAPPGGRITLRAAR
jgi:2',3'-cyclic-nucleotide 2'-phosphodiesterase (5'-nucleotidase family)